MTELNDRQTAILVDAASRAGGSVLPLPTDMELKGGARSAVLRALERRGLVVRAADEVWTITDAGRAAVTGTRKPNTSDVGDAALPAPASDPEAGSGEGADADGAQRQMPFRPGTRQAQLLVLLQRKEGADLDEMVQITGWQAHSVRAVLTGFRKRGIEVVRTREGNGVSVYRATIPNAEGIAAG